MPVGVDLGELYEASYGRLVAQLYAVCGDVAAAEDAVQDAFVTAIRKRRQLADVANPEAWVRVTALNQIRSGWRHLAVVRRYQPQVPGPQVPVEVGPEHVAIVAALARLELNERIVVVLHHLADLSTAAIAAELGISEGTVKSRLSRGRRLLAGLLDDSVGEEPRHA